MNVQHALRLAGSQVLLGVEAQATLQLRAEAYNFTNSPTWGGPGTTVNAPSTFGIVTSRSGNRTMQMAIKLIF